MVCAVAICRQMRGARRTLATHARRAAYYAAAWIARTARMFCREMVFSRPRDLRAKDTAYASPDGTFAASARRGYRRQSDSHKAQRVIRVTRLWKQSRPRPPSLFHAFGSLIYSCHACSSAIV